MFTLHWGVLSMKAEEEAQGLFLLLRPHPSGCAAALNATPTFVLIPAFSCSCQFSFNSSHSSFHSFSILRSFSLSHTHSNKALEINSTYLFHFCFLAQGWYHQLIGKHLPSESRSWLLLSTTPQAVTIHQYHTPGSHYASVGVSRRKEVYSRVSSPYFPVAFPLTLTGVLRARLSAIRASRTGEHVEIHQCRHLLTSLCLSNPSSTLLPARSV